MFLNTTKNNNISLVSLNGRNSENDTACELFGRNVDELTDMK
jgi:hypothetical protein